MPYYTASYIHHTISYFNAFAHSAPSAWNALPSVVYLANCTSPLMTLPQSSLIQNSGFIFPLWFNHCAQYLPLQDCNNLL